MQITEQGDPTALVGGISQLLLERLDDGLQFRGGPARAGVWLRGEPLVLLPGLAVLAASS
jgi:hypothetical protein